MGTAVTDRLRRLFAGYNAFPPTAFVLAGNFLSSVGDSNYAIKLREHLKQLGEMIAEFPALVAESQFYLVPGPADPGSPPIFPRPPLPTHLTQDFARLVPNAKFLSNPARVQYCTQEIVIFREDIVTLCTGTSTVLSISIPSLTWSSPPTSTSPSLPRTLGAK